MSLSVLIWLPLVGSLIASALPKRLIAWTSAAPGLATLGLAVYFLARFDVHRHGEQFGTDVVWIGQLGVHYAIAIDGLNVALILLTALLFAAALIWSASKPADQTPTRPGLFYVMFGAAETCTLGAFCAQDLMLFVAFFDVMIVPFYFLMGIWAPVEAERRRRATTEMAIYTLAGSMLLLAAAIAVGVIVSGHGPLDYRLSQLTEHPLNTTSQRWIFIAFAVAFVVKMPLVPLHGWVRETYRAMPIPALAVFSGVVSKVASYGFVKLVLPLCPAAVHQYQTLMLIIAVVTIGWATVLAFTTTELRLVAAYSGMAQLGFITLGIFSLQRTGTQGALLQMISHGLVSASFLFIVAVLAQRAAGSQDLGMMGGLAQRAPRLAVVFLIVTLATLAMPGTPNFAGELMILLGTFDTRLVIAVLASAGVVGAAVYSLRVYIGTMHNRLDAGNATARELTLVEALPVVPMVAVIVGLALSPQFLLKRSQTAVDALSASVNPPKAHAGSAPLLPRPHARP